METNVQHAYKGIQLILTDNFMKMTMCTGVYETLKNTVLLHSLAELVLSDQVQISMLHLHFGIFFTTCIKKKTRERGREHYHILPFDFSVDEFD